MTQAEQIAQVTARIMQGEGPRTAFVLMYRAANIAKTMPEIQDPFIVANALDDALREMGYLSPEGLAYK